MFKRRRGLYKNYLSDRSNENKRNIQKVEKALKYELRRCEMEAMDKIAEDLEDAARPKVNLVWEKKTVMATDFCNFVGISI